MPKTFSLLILILLMLMYNISVFAQNTLHLTVLGVDDVAKKNILATLETNKPTDPSSEAEVQRFQQSVWLLTIQVKPGSPLHLRHLDLKVTGAGLQDSAFQQLLANFPLQVGQVFSVPDYNTAKNRLLDTARQRGYVTAQLEKAEIIINLQTYSAAITLHFDTGKRYRFGDLLFTPTALDTHFLARFAPFHHGDYYETDKIHQFQENLRGSNYFKQVFIDPRLESNNRPLAKFAAVREVKEGSEHRTAVYIDVREDSSTEPTNKFSTAVEFRKRSSQQEIPIRVQLTPLPAHQYAMGVGYGTDTGVRGLLNYELRPVTHSGDIFKTTLAASQIASGLQAGYIIPGINPVTDQYIFSAGLERQDQNLGKSNLQKLVASYVTKFKGWQQTLSLSLQNESSLLGDQSIPTQLMLLPGVNWSRTTQDDPVRPTRGTRISFGFTGALPLFSNTSFLQTNIRAKTLFPLFGKSYLILRASLGYTLTQNINEIPLSLQFLGGGSESVRGYPYASIGPGTHMLIGSMEYRQHVKGNWYGAAFVDAGSVTNEWGKDLHRAPGVGVVWQSPVGTIALTLAQGMDSPGKPLLLQFSMGPDL